MTKQIIIDRLNAKNWLFCGADDNHSLALIINACIDANIKWHSGHLAHQIDDCSDIVTIAYLSKNKGIAYSSSDDLDEEESKDLENITEWFFTELNR